jgi:hypothetical protein
MWTGNSGTHCVSVPWRLALQLPSLDTGPWEAIVHQVVWKMGRHFGFQVSGQSHGDVQVYDRNW